MLFLFIVKNTYRDGWCYNSFLVYCRELASGTVSLTGDRAQGDDSNHDSHYTVMPTKSGSGVCFVYNY